MAIELDPQKLLHDIAYLFSHLKIFPHHHIVYRDDGIIQTDHGCYRLALEKPREKGGKAYIALFYGRHPDDLLEDPGAPERESDILYKDRVVLVEMQEVRHTFPGDDEPFDLGWVRPAIVRTEHDLAIANLQETCLHNISYEEDDLYVSRFFTYTVSGERGKRNLLMSARVCDDGCMIVPADGFTFNGVKSEITGNGSRSIKVVLGTGSLDDGNVRTQVFDQFPDQMMPPIALRDLGMRTDRLWQGRYPVGVTDDPMVLWYYAKEKGKVATDNIRGMIKDPEEFARRTGSILAALLADGVYHGVVEAATGVFTDDAIEKAAAYGEREKTRRVPRERQKLVDIHFSRFHHVQSGVHDAVYRCNTREFGGLRYMKDPRRFSFAEGVPLVKPTAERDFKYWLASYLTNPRKTFFSYYGTGGNIHEVSRAKDVSIIGQSSNGVREVYDRGNGRVYAWYHPPLIYPAQRKLVHGAEIYFRSGRVLVFNAWDLHEKMTDISFDEFKASLPATVPDRAKKWLFEPRCPEREVISVPEPSCGKRAALPVAVPLVEPKAS